MNEKFYLTLPEYENLVAHLVKLEENKSNLIDEYFPHRTKERREFSELITKYLREIDKVVSNKTLVEESVKTFPFVIIGSTVEICDLDSQEVLQYTIGGPYYEKTTNTYISYLSPVGKVLLLKRIGDVVSVATPSGTYSYEVKAINLSA